METRELGPLKEVSRLVLGGGGIGQVWGETSRDEALATMDLALRSGINLLDMAPGYRQAQSIVGDFFGGRIPAEVKLTTKEWIGEVEVGTYYDHLRRSLETSLKTMKTDAVDVFFLHNEICPEGYTYPAGDELPSAFATPWRDYVGEVVPAMECLVSEGLTRHWGITGIGHPDAILGGITHDARPEVVQVISNLLDSTGNLGRFEGPARPREIARAARENGIGVMGIRVVQAGALAASFDRDVPPDNPNHQDYLRAAPFRTLCAEWNVDPADIALRYALAMPNVDCIVLGVKNQRELAAAIDVLSQPALSRSQMDLLERSVAS